MKTAFSKRRRRGFTLIELMVVMVIIGILASLSIARYMNFKDRGYVVAATADIDLVRRLLAYYAADWNSYPAAAATYQDIQDQLIDADGNSYGQLPVAYTFEFLTYAVDANGEYIVRAQAMDNAGTVLVATAETIQRE